MKQLEHSIPDTILFKSLILTPAFAHACATDEKGKFDEVVEDHGVRVLIDPGALMHVLGTTMDFIHDRLRYGQLVRSSSRCYFQSQECTMLRLNVLKSYKCDCARCNELVLGSVPCMGRGSEHSLASSGQRCMNFHWLDLGVYS